MTVAAITIDADMVVVGSGEIGPGYDETAASLSGAALDFVLQPTLGDDGATDTLAAAAAGLAHDLDRHRVSERRFDLVAAGWGAAVSLRLAVDRPELVRRLSLLAPSCAARSVMAQPAVSLSDLLEVSWTPDAGAEKILAFGLGQMAGRYQRTLPPAPLPEMRQRILSAIAAAEESLPALLRRVKAPTLLLWGQQDRIEPLDRAMFLHRRLPRASLRVFSGSGHLLALERPADIASVTARFLSVH